VKGEELVGLYRQVAMRVVTEICGEEEETEHEPGQ
jgi:hypothetical protein